jgi:chemotaxis protein methyltransferase CheR
MTHQPCIRSFTITDREFELFRDIIFRQTGIFMSERKKNLVVARLSRRLRALNLGTFTEYYRYLTEGPDSPSELVNLVNRVTTNKTDFFREKHHFDFLKDEVLPEIVADARNRGEKRLRIWSAGCSSGEEPYSIAMTVSDFFENEKGWDVKILATDLDTEILGSAYKGVYSSHQVGPVPISFITRYFDRCAEGYEVNRRIKGMISFRRLNLMDGVFPMKRPFDVIFCRNVMIYFNEETKAELVRKFHGQLRDSGYLFIGHSESLMHMKSLFEFVKHTVYRKV